MDEHPFDHHLSTRSRLLLFTVYRILRDWEARKAPNIGICIVDIIIHSHGNVVVQFATV